MFVRVLAPSAASGAGRGRGEERKEDGVAAFLNLEALTPAGAEKTCKCQKQTGLGGLTSDCVHLVQFW